MYKYEVKCKCGHVGRKNYIVIAFPVIAESGKEAAKKARYFPRVKHDHKDAIINVRKINDEEYEKLVSINNNDLYLKCTNRQEQNSINLTDRIFKEEVVTEENRVFEQHKQYFFGKTEVRNPKRFFKNILEVDYHKEAYAWQRKY